MDLDINILIADDFATMRRIIKSALKQLGFSNIMEANDGSAALSLMKNNKFDLILSDWNMPKMTGLEFLKAMRREEAYKDTPFIMVTAEGQKENVVEAIKSGATNYIIKPFTPDVLKEKIEKVFSSK